MESLDHILNGFIVATQPDNLFFLMIGAVLGTSIGMLPGIGPTAGIALLLPVTFGMDPVSALIMLSSIYYGAMYGNSAAAIMINTPGTASAMMTTLDGYPMALKGRGGAALAISAIGSFIAGTFGILLLTALALPFSRMALSFGPAEYFTLMLFALTSVSTLTGKSIPKGIVSAGAGLMIGTVGIDLQSGQSRFTMGVSIFEDGIDFLIVVVGLFAVAEVFSNVERWFDGKMTVVRIQGKLWMTREEWRRSVKPIMRGSIIGFLVGVLPGIGGTIATVISYMTEKRLSKHPEKFGKGAPEGLAGPEAANNGTTCGAFVPMLTLGIPGSGTTAILLGAFVLYGIQPGPQLFATRPDLVWGLIDSMYLGNIVLLILNLPLIGLFVRMLYTPPGILMALILAISSIGIYSVTPNVLDLYLLMFFGVMGYLFRKLEIPPAPLVLGLLLGDPMEQAFRQAMAISQSDPTIFASSLICVVLLLMAAVAMLMPLIGPRLRGVFGTSG